MDQELYTKANGIQNCFTFQPSFSTCEGSESFLESRKGSQVVWEETWVHLVLQEGGAHDRWKYNRELWQPVSMCKKHNLLVHLSTKLTQKWIQTSNIVILALPQMTWLPVLVWHDRNWISYPSLFVRRGFDYDRWSREEKGHTNHSTTNEYLWPLTKVIHNNILSTM